jgi:dihydroorotase
MANTNPTADTPERVEWLHDEGLQINYVTLCPVRAVTKGIPGRELADISAIANSRAAVMMFFDDGMAVADSGLMRDALIRVAEFD